MKNKNNRTKEMRCVLCRDLFHKVDQRKNRRWCEVCRIICKKCKRTLSVTNSGNNALCRSCVRKGFKIKELFPMLK